METPIIEVENLSKLYRLGTISAQTFRESFAQWWRRRRGEAGSREASHEFAAAQAGPEPNTFWALRDLSFQVARGEVVGIIGRNGAGKSTLLKILSRITEPTSGRARLRGRVASLLEVGTGFHPDLTGRDNVYLNGAILGMRVPEIRRKFDEIVDFSGVEKFIDTPVKRYSSGMYVRLAFAVAAHLEPDILFVDEVLAVGDSEFQKKCLGKMEGVAKQGRTVFFVSHNMVAVGQLCHECLWLDKGALRQKGPAVDVINAYTQAAESGARNAFDSAGIGGTGQVQLLSYKVTNARGETSPLPLTGEDLLVRVHIRLNEPIRQPGFGISVWNQMGTLLSTVNTREQGVAFDALDAGEYEVVVRLRGVSYLPGGYRMSFWVMNTSEQIYAKAESSIAFEIGQSPLYGTTHLDYRFGCVFTDISYTVQKA